jgi:hypothetical protein
MQGRRPVGYVETQVSWVGAVTHLEQNRIITEAQDKFLAENPGMRVLDARWEVVKDGAGMPHYNVYLGFGPTNERVPRPNPRNANDAPPPQIGSLPDDVDGVPLGWKEATFGRGT